MHGSVRYLVPAFLVLLLVGPGCTRKFFRNAADDDVAGVISQKNHFPDWAVKNWYAYPHPDSRYADPNNPDRPPYPPDDYASRLLSPNPQHPTKKTGTGRYEGDGYMRYLAQWDAENRAEDEQPAARGAPPDRIVMPPPPYMAKPNYGTANASATPAAVPAVTPSQSSQWGAAATQPPASSPPPPPLVPAFATTPAAPSGAGASDWVTAKPQVAIGTEPVGTPAKSAIPNITEVRDPPIIGVGSPKSDEPKPLPEVVFPPVVPTPSIQAEPIRFEPPAPTLPPVPPVPQPEKLPIVPQPVDPKQVDPKAVDPKVTIPPVPQPKGAPVPAVSGIPGNEYLNALMTNQQGYRIKLEQAVELGLLNSREFQDRREDLYLAALPVTLERFNLAAHAFFTEQVLRDFTGSNLSGAGRLWNLTTTGGASKNFATGGTLMVQLANQVVINLGQGHPDVAFSNLSLNFMQPFLRGGGFAVSLENLTAAERNLVYGMRSYARFRKLFYVATVAGPSSNLGLTNNPYGLQGLSVNLGRGIGGNLTAPVVGFLPLLQQSAVIANQRKNVAFLERLLRLYQAFSEGGQQSDLQVSQVEVQLLNSRGQMLGQVGGPSTGGSGIRGFLDALDALKLQLGLPLTVGLDLENSPLKPIRLQLAHFEEIYAAVAQLENSARLYNPNDAINQFRPRWQRLLTEADLVKGTEFAKGIGTRWDSWAKLTAEQVATRVADLSKQRNDLLDRRADRLAKGVAEPEAEIHKLAELDAELDLAAFERAVRAYELRPWIKLEGPARTIAQAAAFRDVFNAFYQLVLEARNERLAATRANWPNLPSLPAAGVDMLTVPLDEAYTAGIQSALSSRLDLMNSRGQVVDAYRQIAVEANSLQGVLTVGYNINSGTPTNGNQPFSFSGSRTQQQLTINAELPLVRRAERNNYRAALIGYQRQRRTLMAFEDNIANDVRGDIRELRTLAELYKIQQRVVALQYSQVDNAQAILLAPPIPGAASDAGSAAALTNQLLQAQSNLLSAQNQLYSIYVSYLSARMALYLDLELMQLDDRGVWTDEQATGPNIAARPGTGPGPQPERLPVPQPVVLPAGK